MKNSLDLYKQMFHNSLRLSYKGVVTFELIDSVLNIISSRLEIIEENLGTRKRVYGILLESLQNLCNHIENQDHIFSYDAACIVLTIENTEDKYMIHTGNFIPVNKVAELKGWLDEINNSSSQELKGMYNKVLTNNSYSSKGGGGLGFIDIARKCNSKLNYHFQTVDDHNSFFTLNVCIQR